MMMIKEFAVVGLFIGLMLILFVDFARRNHEIHPVRNQVTKPAEVRLTRDERLIALKYFVEEHLMSYASLLIRKSVTPLYMLRSTLSKLHMRRTL